MSPQTTGCQQDSRGYVRLRHQTVSVVRQSEVLYYLGTNEIEASVMVQIISEYYRFAWLKLDWRVVFSLVISLLV